MHNTSEDKKRLFFGAQVIAPWPTEYPEGRMVPEDGRHLTLGFLGNISFSNLQKNLDRFPEPDFKLGPTGYFDQCLFLPKKNPRVVAWHVHWCGKEVLSSFYKDIKAWLVGLGFEMDKRDFLPHATVARKPFVLRNWKKAFVCLPMKVEAIHLYESFPDLVYKPIWSTNLVQPFEEIEHTADRAFKVRGLDLDQIYVHAQLALSFLYPPMVSFISEGNQGFTGLEEVIEALNKLNGHVDKEMGSPIKAISYAGDVKKSEESILEWEMICDI